MTSKDDKKKAAEVIKNAMTSRPKSSSNRDKLSGEDAALLRMQKAMRDIARPSIPGKRRERKPRRNVSKRNRIILNTTSNSIKQIYQNPEDFAKSFINVNPTISTREVGPGDRYNSDYNCHGKETGPQG